jgi:urocanate hydratase
MVNSLDEALRILKNAVRKRGLACVGLVANAAELIPELARRGILPDLLTDQTPADDLLAYIPRGFTPAQAAELRESDPQSYRQRTLDSIAVHVRGMLELKKLGSVVFEFGNGIRSQALALGVADAVKIPDFASEYLQPDLAKGRSPFTVIALSGDPDDIPKCDTLFGELFPDTDLSKWIAIARRRAAAGLPARSSWTGADEAVRLGVAINELVARKQLAAPIVLGRSIPMNRGRAAADPGPISDSQLNSLLRAASGASCVAFQPTESSPAGIEQSVHITVVADGKPATAETVARLFAKDFAAAFASLPL